MSNNLYIEKVWDILDKYIFDIDMDLYSHVTCAVCRKLLNNAYEGPCGCNYCKKCIEKYLENGKNPCPGYGKECQSKEMCSLDNLVKSNSADRNVSKLSVKCPANSCTYSSGLIDMYDHLGVCDSIDIFCPYGEIGCPAIPMKKDLVENHLLAELPHHNKLLIEWIINMKNDIISFIIAREKEEIPSQLTDMEQSVNLKLSEVMNRNSEEIDRQKALVEHLQAELKNERTKISKLEREVEKKNEDKEKEIEDLKESIRDQLEQMRSELRNLQNKNSKSVPKLFPSRSKQEMDFLKSSKTAEQGIENMEAAINNQIEKFGKNWESRRKDSKDHRDYESMNKIATIQVSSEPLKNIASFEWNIAEIDRVKKKSVVINSDYFYSNNKHHKMWLDLYFGGCRKNADSGMRIRYYVGDGPNTDLTTWPLEGVVSLTIKDTNNKEASLSISKPCVFDKPKMSSIYETFMFLYTSLDQSCVLNHNSVSVECFVGF